MTFLDMVILGFDNLRRTRLRTTLTTLGVIIGIGALTSMVSFGTGEFLYLRTLLRLFITSLNSIFINFLRLWLNRGNLDLSI